MLKSAGNKVSIIHGSNRYRNIYKALELIKPEIKAEIKNKKNILIKPNFLHLKNQLNRNKQSRDTNRIRLDHVPHLSLY